MPIVPYWFLPTNGDSRTDLRLGNAVGAQGSRVSEDGEDRAPDISYLGQIAQGAERLGFQAALTASTSSSSPVTPTWRRRTASERAYYPCCVAAACWPSPEASACASRTGSSDRMILSSRGLSST